MKSFKSIFNEYKQSLSKATSLYEESFLYWVKNYVNKKENLFNPYNFLPGKIYSYEYVDELKKDKKFINKRPIVFFIGFTNPNNRYIFSGVDLILIPPLYRLEFLARIYSVYERQIEENIKRVSKGSFKDQIPLKIDYQIMNIIMKDIPFKNAYMMWNIKKIRDVKEIFYEDWTKIVYLHTRSIEGCKIEEIYNKNSKI